MPALHSCQRYFSWSVEWLVIALTWAFLLELSHADETIRVDCAQSAGIIRPLHGVNGGPLVDGETTNLSGHWRKVNVPITRLHDCEWPLPDVVDFHAVFPHSDADPNDPASYRFQLTDTYLQALVDTGAKIVYRLGESIEHSAHKQYVHPPADCDRWAAACLGIIRHYNEGWADGFHHNIRYWEIWNEPENRPSMWSGRDEDYYRLYRTAAKAIKTQFPELQVGGPAVGATGEVVDDRLQATDFLTGLVNSCREQDVPLDFFSWHTYTDDPFLYVRKARAIRRWLDDYGFTQTKIHLNEWNYLPENDWTPMLATGNPERRQAWFETIGGAEGAAFTACVLAYLQDTPVDVANYYNGDINPFGLFNRHGVPRKSYYALEAFQRLLATPQRVAAEGGQAGRTAICAGTDAERRSVTLLLSNLRGEQSRFSLVIENTPWSGPTAWTARVLDADHNLDELASGIHAAGNVQLKHRLPAPGVLLLQLRPASQEEVDPRSASTRTEVTPAAQPPIVAPPERLRLLPLRNIRVTSPFWSTKLDVYRRRTIPHSWQYMAWELRALKYAIGEPAGGDLNGTWGEANLHKFLETCACSLAQAPDPALEQRTDDVIRLLGRAQQSDGYLHAYVTNNRKTPWDPGFLDGSHDGYVLGHMIEAAIAYHAATGKDAFLQIARRAADQAHQHFLGPDGHPGFCGHAELEMALVELYRVTGESRYLELARAFVEWRGRGKVKPFSETPRAYFQDHVPLRQQETLEGHAVRAIFFATGVADLAIETGEADYRLAAQRFWDSTARRRMAITGNIGPRQEHEALGEDYELPLDGYYESCAACGLADFAERMLLLERCAEYADVLERVLYNAVLHGIALDGTATYYQNPLCDAHRPRDNCWVCCPPNLSRTLMQIGRYALAYDDQGVDSNLYIGGTYTIPLPDATAQIRVETDYPWDGRVRIEFISAPPRPWTLSLRIPGWCHQATCSSNDEPATAVIANEHGYVPLRRTWQAGDSVELKLEMQPRWIEAHPNIRSCEGRIALQRGPLVYAFEALDNGGNLDFTLGSDPPLSWEHRPDLLGGTTVIQTQAADGRPLLAIPFYALANRAPSTQQVWIAQPDTARRADWWQGKLYRPANP